MCPLTGSLGCALIAALALPASVPVLPGAGHLAQSESYMVGPGTSVGPGTKVEPKNCVTKPDGSISCDTQLENAPSDSPAKPVFEPFPN